MKKIISLLVILTLMGCGLETKIFSDFYSNDIKNINKIILTSGETGNNKTVTDQNLISEFLDNMKNIKFIPDENQEERDGFRYSITIYEDDKETLKFSLNKVNGNYYHIEPDIYPIVKDFYEKLD